MLWVRIKPRREGEKMRIRLAIAIVLVTVIGLQAASQVSEVVDSGDEIRLLAQVVATGGGAQPQQLLDQIDQISGEESQRRHAARYLKLLALAACGREEELAQTTKKILSGPWIDELYALEAIRMMIEGNGLTDATYRQRALNGKATVVVAVERGGAPFSGDLFWSNTDDQQGRIVVDEGKAGPFLFPPGESVFSAVIEGQPVEFGTVNLKGWSSVILQLSAAADNRLKIVWPEEGAEIADALPIFRWRYTPGPNETIEVSVARQVGEASWMTIWGPYKSDKDHAAFASGPASHEPLRVGEVYEVVVTVVGPPDPKAGPAAAPQRGSRARRFSYEGK